MGHSLLRRLCSGNLRAQAPFNVITLSTNHGRGWANAPDLYTQAGAVQSKWSAWKQNAPANHYLTYAGLNNRSFRKGALLVCCRLREASAGPALTRRATHKAAMGSVLTIIIACKQTPEPARIQLAHLLAIKYVLHCLSGVSTACFACAWRGT